MLAALFNRCQRPSSLETPQSLPRNVSLYAIQKNTLQAQSDILGIAISAAGRVTVTAATLQHPAVFGLFARWLEDNMPFAQPFPFTTIAMTYGCLRPFNIFTYLCVFNVGPALSFVMLCSH